MGDMKFQVKLVKRKRHPKAWISGSFIRTGCFFGNGTGEGGLFYSGRWHRGRIWRGRSRERGMCEGLFFFQVFHCFIEV
jgi:hypothetical protein